MRRANFLYICGLAVAFIFAAAPADAAIDKCQASLEKEADKLKKDVRQRLEKCFDFVQKEAAKRLASIAKDPVKAVEKPNWDFTKAAASCEKQLSKTYPSGGSISKFKSKFNSLFPSKCTDDDLLNLENLIGGRGAPGSPNHAFLREWTLVAMIHEAVTQALLSNGRGRDLLQWSMEGFPAGSYGKDANPRVDCGGNPSHPNLCLYHRNHPSSDNTFDEAAGVGALNTLCRLHSCILDANEQNEVASNSKSSVNLPAIGVIPLALPGTITYQYCALNGIPFVDPQFHDFMFVYGQASKGLTRITEVVEQAVCVEAFKFQGWAACVGGTGAPTDSEVCFDHNTDNGDDCNAPGAPVPEACFCVDRAALDNGVGPCGGLQDPGGSCVLEKDGNGANIPCTAQNTECGAGNFCGSTVAGAVCHPSRNGNAALVNNFSGSAAAGDTMGISQTTITLVGNDDFGPDGIPCTQDDPQATGADAPQVLTTGRSLSTIFDAMFANGVCTAGPNTNAHCSRDEDCGIGGNCTGAILNAQFNNSGENLEGIPFAGGCAQLETSDLSGYLFVGSFPFPDGLGLGDGSSSSLFFCK